MHNTFEIKICGINDEISMATAVEFKVEYIGLVFYEKSPRNVSIDYSKKLLNYRSKHSQIVALTVDPDDSFIADLKKNVKPDYLQLHGNETPKRCKEIKTNFDIPIIKGIGIKNKLDLIEAKEKAEELLTLKSQFISTISHELRTPLYGVIGIIDIIKDENPKLVKALGVTGIPYLKVITAKGTTVLQEFHTKEEILAVLNK